MSAAAAIAAKRKKILRAFREADALAVDRARSLHDLGLRSSMLFRQMERTGVLLAAGDGRYYLDEKAEEREHGKRMKRAAWLITASILVVVAIWVFEKL